MWLLFSLPCMLSYWEVRPVRRANLQVETSVSRRGTGKQTYRFGGQDAHLSFTHHLWHSAFRPFLFNAASASSRPKGNRAEGGWKVQGETIYNREKVSNKTNTNHKSSYFSQLFYKKTPGDVSVRFVKLILTVECCNYIMLSIGTDQNWKQLVILCDTELYEEGSPLCKQRHMFT